ncbi:MAG: hypothetical protein CME31_18440 [Gimesia sp.]|uniref:Uncharacterized protein n=1 Tax=Gimesia maris TaxID=122 RepID=A0A3D3R0V8_9PLAN|nr:hypothetical protein [Gimesia sp.]HCO21868.1 hypothetical protein [Gimesia maris]
MIRFISILFRVDTLMNKLLLALQGFEDLGPLQEINMTEEKSDCVEAWLKESVCPVVEELVDLKTFQSNTIWSASHLSKGVETRERKLVEDVDDCLVKFAVQLEACFPYIYQARIPIRHLNDIRFIAQRRWFDLVHAEDFYQPTQQLLLEESNNQHINNFRNYKQNRTPGDHVCDSMFVRIKYWKEILEKIYKLFFATIRINDEQSMKEFSSLIDCVTQLDSSVKELQKVCLKSTQKTLRDACTTLSLIYLSYADRPELNWLVEDSSEVEVRSRIFRSTVARPPGEIQHVEKQLDGTLKLIKQEPASLCDPAVIRKVAQALMDIKSIYEVPDSPEDLIDWACSQSRLVLVDHSPRQVFWDGEPIVQKWDTEAVQWNLLWILAYNPGIAVDKEMLHQPQGQKINSRRSRLKKLLADCIELNDLITTVYAQGYRLELKSDDITLLESDGLGGLNRVPTRKSNSINS